MQSQPILKALRIKHMFDKNKNVTGCVYFKGQNKLFDYNLINGKVLSAIIP